MPIKNDEAVSPAVGVTLTVTITVIIVAVIIGLHVSAEMAQPGSVQFTILDIDDETHGILTTAGETMIFRHREPVSAVQFKHEFSMLQLGKRYSCELYNPSRFTYPSVYNCTEVLS